MVRRSSSGLVLWDRCAKNILMRCDLHHFHSAKANRWAVEAWIRGEGRRCFLSISRYTIHGTREDRMPPFINWKRQDVGVFVDVPEPFPLSFFLNFIFSVFHLFHPVDAFSTQCAESYPTSPQLGWRVPDIRGSS